MKIQFVLSGQVAHQAGCSQSELEVAAGTPLGEALAAFGAGLPAEAAAYLDDATLFVAVDGEHAPDRERLLPEGTREVLIMSPMAGG